jgi:hypothetical protein
VAPPGCAGCAPRHRTQELQLQKTL